MTIAFDSASSESVSLPTNLASLQNVAAATLSLWATPVANPGSEERIFHMSVNGSGATRFGASVIAGIGWRGSARRLDGDSSEDVDSVTTTSAGVPVHLVVVAHFTAQLFEIFLDGVSDNSTAPTGWTGNTSNTTSDNTRIAGFASPASQFFDGDIDDLRLYNRALSDEEIAVLYKARGRDRITNGLVHRFKMNELEPGAAASVSVIDISNSAAHGTTANTPTYASRLTYPRSRSR